MTRREYITLQKFIEEYRRDKEEDKLWKNEFREWRDKVVTPLIKEDNDNKAVNAWLLGQRGNVISVLGAFLTILLILNAVFNGFFHNAFQWLFIKK